MKLLQSFTQITIYLESTSALNMDNPNDCNTFGYAEEYNHNTKNTFDKQNKG